MPSRRSMLMISEGEFDERGKKVRVPFLVGWSWIFKNSCLDGTPAHITCSLPVYWDAAELTSTDPVVRHPTWYNNEHVMVSSALFSNVSESSPLFSRRQSLCFTDLERLQYGPTLCASSLFLLSRLSVLSFGPGTVRDRHRVRRQEQKPGTQKALSTSHLA